MMAPNLALPKHELIYDMIYSGEPSIIEMARVAGCNKSTISRIFSNIRANKGVETLDFILLSKRGGLQQRGATIRWSSPMAKLKPSAPTE